MVPAFWVGDFREVSFLDLCAARWAAGLLTLLADENDVVASASFDDLPYALGLARAALYAC